MLLDACWGCPRFAMPLSHPVCFSFPFFSTTQPLFFLFSRESSVEIVKFWASEPTPSPSLRLVWAQNQPNFRPNRQNAGNFAENPCIPGNYPATAWVFCRFPQFCLRFCPRPALRLRENSEFQQVLQNGAPNTLCFPWKFPETQSAGDPLFSFLFSGKPR